MRIVHLIDDLGCGGAEQVVASLACRQSRSGHLVRVICLRGIGSNPVDVAGLIDAGVEILTLDKPPGFHFDTLRKLKSYLKSHQIEVLHAHNHLVHHYGAVAARLAGTPAILNTLHGTSSLLIAPSWAKSLYWISCFMGDKVVSVCSQVHGVIHKSFHLPPKKCVVVDNGVDLSQFLGIRRDLPGKTVTFGSIGRLDPVKDHKNLLNAFAILRKRHPHVQLRLLGDGELRDDLEELARNLSIADRVHFEGFTLETARFLSSIDVYVISSRSEGLPLVLLEAMGAALPIVATAVGEVPSILRNAQCGWICPPSSPDELAESMEKALVAPDLAAIGARGRRAVELRYSAERMARDYIDLYEAVLCDGLRRSKAQRVFSGPPGAAKKFGLLLLSISGAIRLSEYVSSRNLLVLTFHRVIPRDWRVNGQRPPNTLFTDEFEEQMAFVARRFNVLSGDDLRAVVEGAASIPRYSLAITFDDGYENNFRHALPILQRHGLHTVLFITTNLIGDEKQLLWFDRLDRLLSIVPSAEILTWLRRFDPSMSASPNARISPYFKTLSSARQSEILDGLEQQVGHAGVPIADRAVHGLMNWDQVRAMVSAGMTIGSHTANHQILAAASPAEVNTELLSSRERIEQETGQTCWCFAYPNGGRRDFRPSDELAVQSAGYRCAFTQISGSINHHTPRFALPRIPIPDTGDMRIFRSYLSGIQRVFRTIFPEK
jgi:glycosyltransferase involved in cell wall biosynthesis/peptidoglycan/xylan/chitin deacetylase (PgdA/CDA1 family)